MSRPNVSRAPSYEVPAPVARQDLTLTVLSVLLIVAFIAAAFWILRPFLLAVVWATMIVVATWPMMLRVQSVLRRRSLAVVVMTLSMLLVFVAPLVLAIDAVIENADTMMQWARALAAKGFPAPPDWLPGLPLVGAQWSEKWAALAATGPDQLVARLSPYATQAAQWLFGAFGSAGALAVQLLLTIIVCVVMFANGETARHGLLRFGRRLGGDRGEGAVVLAGQAIRAVALGVVVTALVQTVLAGIGLALAGIPFAGLLTGIVLLLCIAQLGPILVLAPAVAWLYYDGAAGRGTALLVWTVLVGSLDNILRPILIRRGADLPLLLILSGVIGGLLAFGIVGLFVGPVVLAVGYTLLKQWLSEAN